MNTWLNTSWHWLIIVGVLLAILGLLYTSNSYLDQKLLKRLTKSFTFGIVGGIVGGISCEFVLLPFFLIGLIYQSISYHRIFINNTLISMLSLAIFVLPIGLALGVIVGFFSGLLSGPTQMSDLSSKKFYLQKNFYLNLVSVLMLMGASIYTIFSGIYIFSSLNMFSSFFIFLSIGFIYGLIFDIKEVHLFKRFLIILTICISYILILKLFYVFIHEKLNIITPYLTFIVWGFLLGFMFNQSPISGTLLRKPSWKNFALWFVVGLACGVVLPLLAVYLLSSASQSDKIATTVFLSAMGLLIGLGSGEGNKLIKQLKPHARYIEGQLKTINNSWRRFFRSFLIAFLSTISFMGLLLFDGFISGFYFGISRINILVIISVFCLVIIFAFIIGMITGSIFVSGYAIARKVESLSETRLGQIGILITVLGVLIAALPSLLPN